MQKIKELWHKLKNDVGLIRYLIIGILTTLVNYLVYALATRAFHANEYIGLVVSWIAAVTFAYVGNKIYVFESKTHGAKDSLREIGSFVSMRLISLGLEALIFWIMATLLQINDLIVKLFAQVLVIISNYIFSKFFIFTGAKKKTTEDTPQEPASPADTEAPAPDEKEKD